jgi:hypothetical protein
MHAHALRALAGWWWWWVAYAGIYAIWNFRNAMNAMGQPIICEPIFLFDCLWVCCV